MECIKDEVIKMIAKMPNDVSIDDIMEELYFKLQVNRGLQELDEGKGIPHEEVEKRMQQWLSK
jgi:predicted transcriptional regulator